MALSSPPVTTMASGPIVSPKAIGPLLPELIGSRKFVLQDDPDTSDFYDPLSGVPKGKALRGSALLLNGNLNNSCY